MIMARGVENGIILDKSLWRRYISSSILVEAADISPGRRPTFDGRASS